MSDRGYRAWLEAVRDGRASVDEALAALRRMDAEDLGFARIDHHRALRKGFPEVVYCEGKTDEQAAAILVRLCESGDGPVLGTRASAGVYERVQAAVPDVEYHPLARVVRLMRGVGDPKGHVLVVCAGTSDLPVAEEAALTAEAMGARVERLVDVGVAGLHRLLSHLDRLYESRVIVVVAGMEGALVSVIAGLVDKPVIAVPTSVGYGTQFHGVTPLLSMLNACASGVGVVNIDNGFGAGYLAALINRLGD
ncbi:MAG: nickel pincer cofactor biosynthesis protein LarB [Alicyclobacillus macrosporangiidus]|uniref:nickel pincer cofactor biosynthesis protein LarB n=1 Tax=Alicyclobacillus macrosporangiidus TaxID=392015 RepID=UPI0026F0A56E|nr:nickel pincer cofactor biosynthesis protein LarB [Alicyclobacillus macrosporangiidus]MCL6599121.1 nickel pincer cofactor biosynthesis protein LarB [Alicyclobacillus macrosporangiidus]